LRFSAACLPFRALSVAGISNGRKCRQHGGGKKVSGQPALARQYEALAAAQPYRVVSRNPFDRLTDIDVSLRAGNKIGGACLRVNRDVSQGSVTSITASRFWNWKPENDRDFTGLSIVSRSQNPSQEDQYSQEFRYGHDGEKVDFAVGAFGQRLEFQLRSEPQL
jgi:iron complex outermembrane receptor protein